MNLANRIQALRINACRWKRPDECRGPLTDDDCGDGERFQPKCAVCRELVAVAQDAAADQLRDQLAQTVELFNRGWIAGITRMQKDLCTGCVARAQTIAKEPETRTNVLSFFTERQRLREDT